MLIVLTGVLMAYAQAAFASGTSLIYVILRKKKDDENMLEWEDPDFEDFDFDSDLDNETSDEGAGDTEDTASTESSGDEDKPDSSPSGA